jgi:hypothetical protein
MTIYQGNTKRTQLRPDYRNNGKYQFITGYSGSGATICVHLSAEELSERLAVKHGEGKLIDDGDSLWWEVNYATPTK